MPQGNGIETLLEQVTKELTEFEARKLADLKKELEQVKDKKQAAIDEYKKEYKALRETWCTQQQVIERQLAALKCAFPGEQWKTILSDCLCGELANEKQLAEKLRKRLKCCRGPKERAWEERKEIMASSKARLEVLVALTAKVKAQLSENEKLIGEVKQLLGGKSQADALYVMFVKLLPMHIGLRPEEGISVDCTNFGAEDAVEKICADSKCGDRYEDDSVCEEKAGAAEEAKPPVRRPAPWIVPLDNLGTEIDGAAQDYREAKKAAADAEAAYKLKPDDVESLKKELATLRSKLEETIRNCLKTRKTEDKCCTQTN